jgi:hypothetical protein
MNVTRTGTMLVLVLGLLAAPARAELRHVEIKTLGMD